MLLVAESGSTKTNWRLISSEGNISFETKGINPFFASEDFILSELNNSGIGDYKSKIERLVFYGAGCSSEDRNEYLKKIFSAFFKDADVLVDHDMMSACISLFGDGSGIACIIGTGSNSCVYKEGTIIENVPALGYVLGDEASGSYIGKEILKHYIYKTLPIEIGEYIADTYKIDKEDIFEAVYKKVLPNRYLASFSMIASKYRDTEFIQEILYRGFEDFTKYHILCYKESKVLPISAVGSVAAVFEREFVEVLKKSDLTLAKVDKAPIDALVSYYS